jgi:hypothetical protein
MRIDPTDTGGLFVGRRPGTRPVKYRALPDRGSAKRQHFDRGVAVFVLVVMFAVNLLFWGPLPAAWLWVGSHVQYETNSVSVGILVAFIGLMFTLLAMLVLLRRLDHVWILVRRAAGYDQREGVMGRMFALVCIVGTAIFAFWFIVLSGAELAPLGIRF